MKILSCYEAYVEGCNDRLRRPLNGGRYKVTDFFHDNDRWLFELRYIRRFISGRDELPLFSCCTRSELAAWLKRLPALIAYKVGYDLLPGMEALFRDGVPLHLIEQERPYIQSRAFRLLEQLEQLSQALSRGIESEYSQMRKGKSRLEVLTEQASKLADHTAQIGNGHHDS